MLASPIPVRSRRYHLGRMDGDADFRREQFAALAGVLRARHRELSRQLCETTPAHHLHLTKSRVHRGDALSGVDAQLKTLSRAVGGGRQLSRLTTGGLLADAWSGRLLGQLGLTATPLKELRARSLQGVGVTTGLRDSRALGVNGVDFGFRSVLRDSVRDVAGFSSLPRSGAARSSPLATVGFGLKSRVHGDLTAGMTRQPHLGTFAGIHGQQRVLSALAGSLARQHQLGLVGGVGRAAAFELGRLSGGDAALTRLANSLKPVTLAGAADLMGPSRLLDAVVGVDGRRLAGLAAGFEAGRLARQGGMSSRLAVGWPPRLADAMADAVFSRPQTLMDRLVVEASALPDALADPGLDVRLDEEDAEGHLLASAISTGQSLFEVVADATQAAAEWAWYVPLWWAPTLLQAWPALTDHERQSVRYKAAAASGALMTAAGSAATGNLILCLSAVLGAYGALGDFFLFVRQLEHRS